MAFRNHPKSIFKNASYGQNSGGSRAANRTGKRDFFEQGKSPLYQKIYRKGNDAAERGVSLHIHEIL